jgi:hypothetical protein
MGKQLIERPRRPEFVPNAHTSHGHRADFAQRLGDGSTQPTQ